MAGIGPSESLDEVQGTAVDLTGYGDGRNPHPEAHAGASSSSTQREGAAVSAPMTSADASLVDGGGSAPAISKVLHFHGDNETMLQVCRTGRNPTMRHLGRTHGISIQWLHDETTKETCELHYIETANMAADIFTKFFPQAKASTWTEARKLINVLSPEEFEEMVGDPGGGYLSLKSQGKVMAVRHGGGDAPADDDALLMHLDEGSRQITRVLARAFDKAAKRWTGDDSRWTPVDETHFDMTVAKAVGGAKYQARLVHEGDCIPNDLGICIITGEARGCELAAPHDAGQMGSEYVTVGARALACVSPGTRVLGTRGRPCWLLRRRPLSAVSEDFPPPDVAGSVCMCVGVGGGSACEEELFGDSKTSQLGNTAGGTKRGTQNPSSSSRNHTGSKICSKIPSVSKSRRTAVSARCPARRDRVPWRLHGRRL